MLPLIEAVPVPISSLTIGPAPIVVVIVTHPCLPSTTHRCRRCSPLNIAARKRVRVALVLLIVTMLLYSVYCAYGYGLGLSECRRTVTLSVARERDAGRGAGAKTPVELTGTRS